MGEWDPFNLGKEPTGAADTPCGGWLVTRLRIAWPGTVNVTLPSMGIGPEGVLGELGVFVSRQLILTKACLIETDQATMKVADVIENSSTRLAYAFTAPLQSSPITSAYSEFKWKVGILLP